MDPQVEDVADGVSAGAVAIEEDNAAAALLPVQQGAAANGMVLQPVIRKPKRLSEAWEHFHDSKLDANGKLYANCKYCPKKYACHSRNHGTSNMLNHSRTCIKNPARQKGSTQPTLIGLFSAETGKRQLSSWKLDHALVRENIARMLIVNELPFRHVESDGFRRLIESCYPQFRVPSRTTITKYVKDLYVSEKKKFKKFLASKNPRLSLTTDTWTSNQQINYMSLTAHFVDDDWKLHKRIINFCPIHSHKGEDIGKAVEKCLVEWGITKVMTITVDNASSNEPAISHLRRKLNLLGTNILGGKYMHMRCIAHIINLIVSDGISIVGKSVERIRVTVRYIKQSPSRLDRFKSCVAGAGIKSKALLCLDVPTRWNSTYLMCKAALNLEGAFELYDTEDPSLRHELETKVRKGYVEPLGMLCFEDWINVKSFMKFFNHFYEVTCRVSGSSYVTSNTFLDEISDTLQVILKGQQNIHDFNIVQMSNKMKEKFDKYWSDVGRLNLLIFISSVFDPRNKLLTVLYVVDAMYTELVASSLSAQIKHALLELYNEYVRMHANVGSGSGISCGQVGVSQPTSVGDVNDEPPTRGLMRAAFKRLKSSQEGGVKTELERYLSEDVEAEVKGFNVLLWWKCNSSRFPILSMMARDILGIHISTVSSESAFSAGGRFLTDFRSSLSPALVEALVCTQDWIRESHPNINLEIELEELAKVDEEFNDLSL